MTDSKKHVFKPNQNPRLDPLSRYLASPLHRYLKASSSKVRYLETLSENSSAKW